MSGWWNSWARDERGNALVEFALVLPLWLLLSTGMLEVGRGFYQAGALEKSVRAGALYLARHSFPLTAATITEAENLVKTGSVDGGGFAVSGWGLAAADLQITTLSFSVDGTPIPVVRVAASVPFDPMLNSLPAFVGLDGFTLTAQHEQAYVGD
ncbi:MAG: TadE/TadG family type IV pilus assembly protein [Rhodospirillales bacterium]|jgi:hypothetical protein|nr:hypothetical protein [Rhodospirillaceae bacterium]MDP6428981.1 TadE/TadG family type IV pilus assembly protein [Rhodospirillales bacterium]MDP6646702.1 TadE/TadG family type IV pilus assembly protein [Rhodospirillales bacterium]MDP6842593.1 TadE/TadG family type IV pilus assembly protein [Rhodospirillales bacterium]|tara:strand:+ start:423 stop:884 length:462 start_codon:yes stop_codon:yes gene_type:complete